MQGTRKKKQKLNPWPYLLLAPALAIMLTVVFVPIVNAMSMSLQHYDLRYPSRHAFVGMGNYVNALGDRQFWLSLRNTGIWLLFGVGFQFVFGFMLALLLNKQFRGRGIARSASLIPWVTPGVLIALMWMWILDGNYGVLNDMLKKAGLIDRNIAFLTMKFWAMPAVIVAIVWQGIPFFALMLLAGLQGISYDLYEAASIDGANVYRKFAHVTLPSLKNTILVTTLLRIIWVANSVDVIFNMTGGGPAYATQTLSVYVYLRASILDMGYASSMAIILTLLLLLFSIPYAKSVFSTEGMA